MHLNDSSLPKEEAASLSWSRIPFPLSIHWLCDQGHLRPLSELYLIPQLYLRGVKCRFLAQAPCDSPRLALDPQKPNSKV
jgi:hypothetical protein